MDENCKSHVLPEHEGISIEWDEDVLNAPNAVTIGRIEQVDDEKITIQTASQRFIMTL